MLLRSGKEASRDGAKTVLSEVVAAIDTVFAVLPQSNEEGGMVEAEWTIA